MGYPHPPPHPTNQTDRQTNKKSQLSDISNPHHKRRFPHPFRVFSLFCFPHLTDDVLDFTEGQVVFRTMYQLQQGRLTSASWTSQFPEFSFQESSDVATQWQNSMTIKGSPCGVCAISCNCTLAAGKSPITLVTVILRQLLGSPSNVLVSHTTEDGDLPPLKTSSISVVKPRNILTTLNFIQFSPRVAQKAQWEAAKDGIFLLRPRVRRSGKSINSIMFGPVSCQTIPGVKEIPRPEHRNL